MLVVSACCRDAILRVSLLKKLRSFQFARPTNSDYASFLIPHSSFFRAAKLANNHEMAKRQEKNMRNISLQTNKSSSKYSGSFYQSGRDASRPCRPTF